MRWWRCALLVSIHALAGCPGGSGPPVADLAGGAPPDGATADFSAPCGALPAAGVYGTFTVAGGERFHASITDPAGIEEALALWRGTTAARIPNGVLRCGAAPWNCPWSWHLDPGSLRFAQFTVEVCDGIPSYVEAQCAAFGERYCPWSAQLVDLRDCRGDPGCPPVPRQ